MKRINGLKVTLDIYKGETYIYQVYDENQNQFFIAKTYDDIVSLEQIVLDY